MFSDSAKEFRVVIEIVIKATYILISNDPNNAFNSLRLSLVGRHPSYPSHLGSTLVESRFISIVIGR
jgi:hypothetical protein